MLTFSPAQWRALREDETQRFVAAVANQLIVGRAELQGQRPDMLKRLGAMHSLAAQLGFTSTPHIIRLLHLAADTPGMHEDPALRAWLPGLVKVLSSDWMNCWPWWTAHCEEGVDGCNCHSRH
jgi:hypothetical protein